MIVIFDQDSAYSYTLAQCVGELSLNAEVYAVDTLSIALLTELKPSHLILAPQFGNQKAMQQSIALIQHFSPLLPTLAIGHGFHSVLHALHGKLILTTPQFGQTATIYHQGVGVFAHLPSPFCAMQTHSYVADNDTLPKTLAITAWTQNDQGDLDTIMGIKHQDWPLEAVLFQPSSILSEQGHTLLRHFLKP